MELTLAMGLKYESGLGYSLLPDKNPGQESGFVRPQNGEAITAEQVLDIEAVEVLQGQVVNDQKRIRHFEYLVYNLHAGVDLIPEIGSKLDTII